MPSLCQEFFLTQGPAASVKCPATSRADPLEHQRCGLGRLGADLHGTRQRFPGPGEPRLVVGPQFQDRPAATRSPGLTRLIMTRLPGHGLRSRCSLEAGGFEFYGGLPAEGGVPPAVVEAFDVFEYRAGELEAGVISQAAFPAVRACS